MKETKGNVVGQLDSRNGVRAGTRELDVAHLDGSVHRRIRFAER